MFSASCCIVRQAVSTAYGRSNNSVGKTLNQLSEYAGFTPVLISSNPLEWVFRAERKFSWMLSLWFGVQRLISNMNARSWTFQVILEYTHPHPHVTAAAISMQTMMSRLMISVIESKGIGNVLCRTSSLFLNKVDNLSQVSVVFSFRKNILYHKFRKSMLAVNHIWDSFICVSQFDWTNYCSISSTFLLQLNSAAYLLASPLNMSARIRQARRLILWIDWTIPDVLITDAWKRLEHARGNIEC